METADSPTSPARPRRGKMFMVWGLTAFRPTPYYRGAMGNLRITVWGNGPRKLVKNKERGHWCGDFMEVEGGTRSQADVEVIKINKKSMWVKLPDGNIIKRKRGRDY